ncbi:unnamed protein product [Lactuca saligna]|uniref:ATP-dependent DNA helicase n=1 Tax=Lactuca saligna TaxID=75948 RepID=A0AA35YZZ0_LACSI|nr:unnamed protein product [Lactuca saligna]
MVGRLVFVHPTSGELFYLRMLLCHQKGCTSFKDLRIVAGIVYPTFRVACNALQLIGDDVEWLTCFTEAAMWATASQLRSLFCHLLIFCKVSNPLSAKSAVPSKSMSDFGLPVPSLDVTGVLRNRLLLEEMSYDKEQLRQQHNNLIRKLNHHQRLVYNNVVSSIDNNRHVLIFVYGHGGTGKTFLWTTILSHLRSIGNIALAVVASGIASLLLPPGTTAHSIKILIDLKNKKSCDIKKVPSLAIFYNKQHSYYGTKHQ